MARQRNNISAVVADAVDLTLDTAGTIASVVGGAANMIGIGSSEPKTSEEAAGQEGDDAAERVATSLRQEADTVQPRPRKAKARNTQVGTRRTTASFKKVVKSSARKPNPGKTLVGTKRSTGTVKKAGTSSARKAKAGGAHLGKRGSTKSAKKAVNSSGRTAKSANVGTKRSTNSVKKSVKRPARKGRA